MFSIVKVVLNNLCVYANLLIILSLNACVSLEKQVLRYNRLLVLVCLAVVNGLIILFFESVHVLGLSVPVSISIPLTCGVLFLPGAVTSQTLSLGIFYSQ